MESYDAAVATIGLGAYAVSMVISLAIGVLLIIAMWKIFVQK